MDQMLTANRLRDGDVLYWKAGAWVERLADGEKFADATAADAALAAAQAFVADNTVVGPYLFDVHPDGRPVKEREIIRASGPSVREDLGKQASNPPLEGGGSGSVPTSKFARQISGRGRTVPAKDPSPKNPPDFSTLPQGEGGDPNEAFDVSI